MIRYDHKFDMICIHTTHRAEKKKQKDLVISNNDKPCHLDGHYNGFYTGTRWFRQIDATLLKIWHPRILPLDTRASITNMV